MASDDKRFLIEDWTKQLRPQTTWKLGGVMSDPTATSSAKLRTVKLSRLWKYLHIIGLVLLVVQGIAMTADAQSTAEPRMAPVQNEDAPNKILTDTLLSLDPMSPAKQF